jgi:hypothetical protein
MNRKIESARSSLRGGSSRSDGSVSGRQFCTIFSLTYVAAQLGEWAGSF